MEETRRDYAINYFDKHSDNMYSYPNSTDNVLNFIADKDVKAFISADLYKSNLKDIGVFITNDSEIRWQLIYPTKDIDIIDKLEVQIQEYAKSQSILIEKIKVDLDFSLITNYFDADYLYLTEDILIPNSNNTNSFINYMATYINDLFVYNKTLIITDPYFFPRRYDEEYVEKVITILSYTSAKKIIFFMPNNFNRDLFDNIKSQLSNIDIEIREFNDCHDRFWICQENNTGFVMGTSLNGIGRKICRIDKLHSEECSLLLSELGY